MADHELGFKAKLALIEPYQQGELDALCSIYSIINAIHWVCHDQTPLSTKLTNDMFKNAIRHLNRKGRLERTAWNGLGDKAWFNLIQDMIKFIEQRSGIRLSITKLSVRANDLSALKQCLQRNEAVLVHIRGAHNHYTVIVGDSAKRWYLFDSDDMSYILHKSLKTSGDRRTARYSFTRNGLYSLRVRC